VNRGELVAEITGARFDVSQQTSVQRWLDAGYAWVWNAGNWRWRYKTGRTTVAVSAGQATPTLPSDFASVGPEGVVSDRYGENLDQYAPGLFAEFYGYEALNAITMATPEAFSIVNGQLTLGAAPATAQNIYLSNYERRPGWLAGGVYTPGPAASDTDTPVWDPEHHLVLVHAAVVIGLALENDPTGGGVRDLRDEALRAMLDSYLEDSGGVVAQWGKQQW
jgi:hypothetical protein